MLSALRAAERSVLTYQGQSPLAQQENQGIRLKMHLTITRILIKSSLSLCDSDILKAAAFRCQAYQTPASHFYGPPQLMANRVFCSMQVCDCIMQRLHDQCVVMLAQVREGRLILI
jgi:hypothetical protein